MKRAVNRMFVVENGNLQYHARLKYATMPYWTNSYSTAVIFLSERDALKCIEQFYKHVPCVTVKELGK